MKRFGTRLLLLGSLALSYSTYADEAKKQPELSPYSLSYISDSYGSAHVKRPHHDHHKRLSLSEGSLMGTYTQLLSETSGLLYGVGYRHTHLDFHHYHQFNQHNINNMLFSFGGFTKTSDDWMVDANLVLQMNTEHMSLSRYTYFNAWVHGKTLWKDDIYLHTGVIAYTGMHFTRVLPILGFEWLYNQKWAFEVIFPSWAKARYKITNNFSLEAVIRTFLSRQRLDNKRDHARRLIAYRNISGEVGLNYTWKSLSANIHGGQTLGSRMRTSDKSGHDRKHFKLKDSFYWGLQLRYTF